MDMSRLNTGLDVLDEDECVRLLGSESVGRLGVVVDDEPQIFPVNFALSGDDIVIRTDHGTKLVAALGGPVVFEVDHFDEDRLSGWSVVVHGTAQLSGGRAGGRGSQNRVLRPWPDAERPHLLRIVAKKITGRRISPSRAHRWPMAGESELAAAADRSQPLPCPGFSPEPGCS